MPRYSKTFEQVRVYHSDCHFPGSVKKLTAPSGFAFEVTVCNGSEFSTLKSTRDRKAKAVNDESSDTSVVTMAHQSERTTTDSGRYQNDLAPTMGQKIAERNEAVKAFRDYVNNSNNQEVIRAQGDDEAKAVDNFISKLKSKNIYGKNYFD